MHFSLVVDGEDYTHHKTGFKKILRRHGLRWVGGPGRFLWTGPDDSVEAYYQRDEERDTTISATLTWRGDEETPFLLEFREWGEGLQTEPADISEPEERKRLERLVESELRFWESIHKPQADELRKRGRPEEWIRRDLKEFEARKEEKRVELRFQYGLRGKDDG